jgi:azurin
MNAHYQHTSAQRRHHLGNTARTTTMRILAALGLAALLAACAAPDAAQQTVAKAIVGEKSIGEIPAPAPAAALAPTAKPIPTAKPAPTVKPAPTATPAPIGQPVSIGTNGGDWQFDTDTLEVAAGTAIALTFHNGAKTTKHNWLLVKGGDDVAAEVNKAGETAGVTADYIADDTRIVARTAGLLKGGQSETVTFTAPAAGTYVYLCTFPGHFEEGMRGVLRVK